MCPRYGSNPLWTIIPDPYKPCGEYWPPLLSDSHNCLLFYVKKKDIMRLDTQLCLNISVTELINGAFMQNHPKYVLPVTREA